MQRCEDRATVKTLKTIRSAHRVQRRSYFVFEAIVRRPLSLEDNLSDTMTNGDLCEVHRCLSRQLTSQGKGNSRLYKCFRTQYFSCIYSHYIYKHHEKMAAPRRRAQKARRLLVDSNPSNTSTVSIDSEERAHRKSARSAPQKTDDGD